MKTALAITLAAGIAGSLPFATSAATAEPPMRLTLTLDGRDHDVEVGKAFKLVIAGKEHVGKLTTKPTRLFDYGGLAFEYPNGMTFEADDETPGVTIWGIEGPDTLLQIQRYPGSDAQQMADLVCESVAEQFGDSAELAKRKFTYRFAGSTRKAKRLLIDVAGIQLIQDYIAIQGDDAAFVLMLQDSSDTGGPCEATERLTKILSKSMRLAK